MAKTAKPKQKHLDGLAPARIPEIDTLAEEYIDVRDARLANLKEEVELKGQLLLLMNKHKLKVYEVPETHLKVCVEPGEDDIKVRKPKVTVEDNGEDD